MISHARKQVRGTALFALCVMWLLGTTAFAQDSTLLLGVGIQKPITIPGIKTVSVADPGIADVKPVGNQVLVTGVSEGRTTLLIWKTSGQRVSYLVVVRKQDPNEVISELRKLLGDIEGVSVRQVGDRIYLDGQALTTGDMDRIEQVIGLYPNVTSFVKVTTNAKRLVAQNLDSHFRKAGLKNVTANVIGATIFLEGSVESQADLQKAELITKALGEKVENLLTVGIKRMVLAEVQFVEIRRSGADRFGVKFPTDISGDIQATGRYVRDFLPAAAQSLQGGLSLQNIRAGIAVGFQMNDGYGRLLAQPRLVCASGEKAEFLAGGEVPIPLITNNQFTVEYKKYGVILNLAPTADRNGNIQMDVEAESSELDQSVAVSVGGNIGIPGFRSRKVKTNVTVRHGETIVLSNVFSHDEQKAVSKLPGLGNIPIIGELFKNRSFDSSKRELVIFITPRIVNPDSDKIRTMIDDIKARYKQARGEVTFNVFD